MSETKYNSESASSNQPYHVPVLLHEAIDGLNIQPGGIYVDCTFGGGGHSREILNRLNPQGKLVAFDQDADARKNLPSDERVVFVPHNFGIFNVFCGYINSRVSMEFSQTWA